MDLKELRKKVSDATQARDAMSTNISGVSTSGDRYD